MLSDVDEKAIKYLSKVSEAVNKMNARGKKRRRSWKAQKKNDFSFLVFIFASSLCE